MTKKQESGATPRQYDAAFKDEAVRMWLTSGQSAEVTARALGISVFHLYEWKKRVSQVSRAAGSAGLPEGKEALQLEVLRLRQENLRLTEQRDILKKAAGILCEPPPRGMPGYRP
jgi:transposase